MYSPRKHKILRSCYTSYLVSECSDRSIKQFSESDDMVITPGLVYYACAYGHDDIVRAAVRRNAQFCVATAYDIATRFRNPSTASVVDDII